jgi:hypothetical protein
MFCVYIIAAHQHLVPSLPHTPNFTPATYLHPPEWFAGPPNAKVKGGEGSGRALDMLGPFLFYSSTESPPATT